MKPKDWGFMGVLGFVGAVLGVAYLSERRRRVSSRTPGAESCPRDEETVQVWLKRLSETFRTEEPPYTFKAGEVCPPQYDACITYPEPIHFKCGHVEPITVAHEYGHWILKKKGSPFYADEDVVESFADLSLRLIAKRGQACVGLVSGMASPICWPGGKRLLTKRLKKMIPPHRVYVEPFAGGAWLFFAKKPAEVNVLGDIDDDLMSFYRSLRDHEGELACDMEPDRERFEAVKSEPGKSVCDYLYLNKTSFSCNMKDFSSSKVAQSKCDVNGDWTNCQIKTVAKDLNRLKELLQKTRLETSDFRELIRKYDSPETFYYLDPPYVEANRQECLYGAKRPQFCSVTPKEVAEALEGIQGKFLVSYDPAPEVIEAFQGRGYTIEEAMQPYSMERKKPGSKGRKVKELLIRNYD